MTTAVASVRLLAAGLALAACLTPAAAETVPRAPEEDVRVPLVQVPVQVTLDGEPVRGLGPDDFEVKDERRVQNVVALDVIDLDTLRPDAPEAWSPAVQMAGRRHFLLVFDQTFSSSAALARARQAAREWIAAALHPSDVVAVATFSVTRGAELLLGFTTDRAQAELAIATLGAGELVDAYADPLRLSLGTFKSGVLEDDQGPGAFLDGFRPLTDADDIRGQQQVLYVATQEPMNDQRRRHDVTALTRSFSDLARMMDSVRGRKYVVYMSEGFDSSLVFATEDDSKQREMSDAIERGGYWLVDSNKRFGNAALQASIFDMLDHFRRADCVIHAVDVGNIAEGGETRVLPASSNGLFLMANETGGELYRNFGNLTGALERMLDRTSVTYLLSFRPDRFDPADDSFHKIKIKLRNGPKGARLSHRPGYYPSIGEDDRPERKALRLGELVVAGGNHGAIPASVLAVPYPGSDDRAQVPVLIEIDGTALRDDPDAATLAVEIFVYAFDGVGRITDFFTQTVGIDVATAGDTLSRTGLKFYGTLDLYPGRHALRVLVRNRDGGAYAVRSTVLEVPAFGAAAAPHASGPLVPEARGRWLLARQEPRADETRPPFPFMVGAEPFLPAADVRLRAGDSARLVWTGFGIGGGDLDLRGSVVDGEGRTVCEDLTLAVVDRGPAPTGGQTIVSRFDVPADLAPGGYRLEVRITDPALADPIATGMAFAVVAR